MGRHTQPSLVEEQMRINVKKITRMNTEFNMDH